MPTRLELVDAWDLLFSLEQDGASLGTLYDKCEGHRGKRGGFVLVVRDGSGNVRKDTLLSLAWARSILCLLASELTSVRCSAHI